MRVSGVSLVAIAFCAAACQESSASRASSGSEEAASSAAASRKPSPVVNLNGAGATFPYPLYSKWVSVYGSAHPDVRINYQSVGSGAGIKQITDRTVDFGASDAPMTDEQLAKVERKLLHIPTTLGAVAIAYNLPEGSSDLRLTGELVGDIFLGEIKRWDDTRIVSSNPGAKLPPLAIAVAHRSDGSGTTAVFTDYLTKVSPAWKSKVGTGTSVNWPAGTGAKGNEGVTGLVKSTPGAVGYCELAYAKQTNLPMALLKNRAGKFVSASLESISAAAAGFVATMPDDFRVSITDGPGDGAYPLASFTYLLVYQNNDQAAKAEAMAKFLWWAVHDGQKYGAPLYYAALPEAVVVKVEGKLKSLQSGDKTLLGDP
jgi:phosphate transport system substrate-binding protein